MILGREQSGDGLRSFESSFEAFRVAEQNDSRTPVRNSIQVGALCRQNGADGGHADRGGRQASENSTGLARSTGRRLAATSVVSGYCDLESP